MARSRLSRVVKEAVAEIVRSDLNDPRLRLVTITDAVVTSDQSYATVYYSALSPDLLAADPARTGGDRPVGKESVAAAFDAAGGRIQGLLGRRLTSRRTPELTFEPDPVADRAARVEALIRKVRDDDGADAGGDREVGDVDPDADRRPDPLDDDWSPTGEPVEHEDADDSDHPDTSGEPA